MRTEAVLDCKKMAQLLLKFGAKISVVNKRGLNVIQFLEKHKKITPAIRKILKL